MAVLIGYTKEEQIDDGGSYALGIVFHAKTLIMHHKVQTSEVAFDYFMQMKGGFKALDQMGVDQWGIE